MIRHYYKQDEYVQISELPESQRSLFQKFVEFFQRPLPYDEETKSYVEDAAFGYDYDNWLEIIANRLLGGGK
jgi:hypothetical protein